MKNPLPFLALVRRDLFAHLRHTRSFFLLALMVAVPAIVLVSLWPSQTMPISQVAYKSATMTYSLYMCLMAAAMLFIPGLAGASIVTEKEQGNYDMLHLTLIKPSGIVLGKFINVLGFFLLMLAAVLPVAGAIFFAVGIDWVEFLVSIVKLVLFAITCAMMGVMISAKAKKTYRAIVGSYIGMLVFMAVSAVVMTVVVGILGAGFYPGGPFIGGPGMGGAARQYGVFLAANLAIYLGLTLLFFRMATRNLVSSTGEAAIARWKPIDDTNELKARRQRFPYYLIDPMQRKKEIEDDRNPMLIKELRFGVMGNTTRLIRSFYPGLVIYFFAAFVAIASSIDFSGHTPDPNPGLCGMLIVQIVIPAILMPAIMANSFSKEYELGNMDMLRMTMLDSFEVVKGKLTAGLVAISPLVFAGMLATIPVFIVAGLSVKNIGTLAAGCITIVLVLVLECCICLLVSLVVKKTSTSIFLGYFLCFMALAGNSILMVFLSSVSHSRNFEKAGWILSMPISFGLTFDGRAEAWFAWSNAVLLGIIASLVIASLTVSIFESARGRAT